MTETLDHGEDRQEPVTDGGRGGSIGGHGCTITPYRDGPYLLRGDFQVTDQEGNEIDAGRRTIALCRCGKSRIRPFCDGTHRTIAFKAPSAAEAERAMVPSRRRRSSGPSAAAEDRPRRARENGWADESRPSCPEDLLGLLEESLRDIAWAHDSISRALDGPCLAEDHSVVRLVEPLVGAARTLIEWRATGTPVEPLPGPEPPVAGMAALTEVTRLCSRTVAELALSWSDQGIRSASALLHDADLAMRRRAVRRLYPEAGGLGQPA